MLDENRISSFQIIIASVRITAENQIDAFKKMFPSGRSNNALQHDRGDETVYTFADNGEFMIHGMHPSQLACQGLGKSQRSRRLLPFCQVRKNDLLPETVA